jgi:hypothetical protein
VVVAAIRLTMTSWLTSGLVERLIREAIQFHLEGMREEGFAIPSSDLTPATPPAASTVLF